jgi:hypothetical protein
MARSAAKNLIWIKADAASEFMAPKRGSMEKGVV